jgi:hypothetical protein
MGLVYVFNATSIQANQLKINGTTVGFVLYPVTHPPYVPRSNTVARSDFPGTATFQNGVQNQVIIITGGATSAPVNLFVPQAPDSTNDLWLYLFQNVMLLLDTNGHLKDIEDILWSTT